MKPDEMTWSRAACRLTSIIPVRPLMQLKVYQNEYEFEYLTVTAYNLRLVEVVARFR